MKSSIGSESPAAKVDGDQDGTPDRSEEDFARDGEVVAKPSSNEASPGSLSSAPPDAKKQDDGLLGTAGGPTTTQAP